MKKLFIKGQKLIHTKNDLKNKKVTFDRYTNGKKTRCRFLVTYDDGRPGSWVGSVDNLKEKE